MSWNWNKIDEMVASFARPYSMYVNSTAIAFAAVWSLVVVRDAMIVAVTVGAAVTLATGQSILRTVDNRTKAVAATEDKRTAAMGGPVAPIKTVEVS